MNPFYGKPIHGKLRNGMTFTARRLKEMTAHVFCLQGHDSDGQPHLWGDLGAWREDGKEHPFDIVSSHAGGFPSLGF